MTAFAMVGDHSVHQLVAGFDDSIPWLIDSPTVAAPVYAHLPNAVRSRAPMGRPVAPPG